MTVVHRSSLKWQGDVGTDARCSDDGERDKLRHRQGQCCRKLNHPPTIIAFLVGAMFLAAGRQQSSVTKVVEDVETSDMTEKGRANLVSNVTTDNHMLGSSGPLSQQQHQLTTSVLQPLQVRPEEPIPSDGDSQKPASNTDTQLKELPKRSSAPASVIPSSVDGWPSECALYLAESTIPNAGFGTFTAVNLPRGSVVGSPDISVPFVDINWHNQKFFKEEEGEIKRAAKWRGAGTIKLKTSRKANGIYSGRTNQAEDTYHFLYANYIWGGPGLDMGNIAERVNVMSNGFGALVNSYPGLQNLDEGTPSYDDRGLHRGKNPGAGAFSPYHDRKTKAKAEIPAGGELFVGYGQQYFVTRTKEIGYIPLSSDYTGADKFLKIYHNFATGKLKQVPDEIKRDFWGVIRNFWNESRSLNALPKFASDIGAALEEGVTSLKREIRSPEWLKENGECLDNIQPQPSTIKQAGRGAFATRFMPKESLVITAPLIHIPRGRDVFRMYEMNATNAKGEYVHNRTKPFGYQLMMNYAFGHPDSSVLLSPYGPSVSFINHASGDEANVRLQWAEPSHEWLNKSVNWLERNTKNAQLSFDFIATRDIQPGEEIFLDYGEEWQKAWTEHVNNWSPGVKSQGYVSASDLNKDAENQHLVLRTSKEQESDPYPNNVQTLCRYRIPSFTRATDIKTSWSTAHRMAKLHPCQIRSRSKLLGEYVYEVRILERVSRHGMYANYEKIAGVPRGHSLVIRKVPRSGIAFGDRPYTIDMFLPNAFRHEIVVSDDIWPESWKNLKA